MRLTADIQTPVGVISNSTLEIDDNGQIVNIFPGFAGSSDQSFVGALVLPGFVDLHVHGAGGADFMDGSVDAVRKVARTHAQFGTTSLLATTLTASRDNIDKAIRSIVEVIEKPGNDEACIRGIHLEGPYICSKRRGAQPESPIRIPDIEELNHWQEISGGRIKQITMAPELLNSLDFIKQATMIGVNVSVGHTDATADQVAAAISSGARQGTHLFNAMSAMTHRSPGAVGALLADERVYCELICDGFHIDPQVVKIAVKAKGVEKTLLITDAMSGAAMPDGAYQLGGQKVVVSAGAARLDDGTLAGSVLTMNNAFCNVMSFTGASTLEASRMSSLNAATVVGIEDTVGSVECGKKADLAILDRKTGLVLATLRNGHFVFLRK